MTANRFLNPTSMAKPPGYTSVVETTGPGRTVYIAGQLGVDLQNVLVGGPDGSFRAQCEAAFKNLGLALAAVGASFDDVVKINSYLVGMTHIADFRAVRDAYVNTKAPPASTTVAISQLARPGALFEVEAIAVLPAKAAGKAVAAKGGRARIAKPKAGKRKVKKTRR